MSPESPRADRRTVALSNPQIVVAAIEILDAGGVDALTFRALAARLSTGAAASYHHVTNREELLAAAAAAVAAVLAGADRNRPGRVIRAVLVAVFDTITAHPWAGTPPHRGIQRSCSSSSESDRNSTDSMCRPHPSTR